ncbi:Protein OS-9 [Pyricularia oryzae]
MRGLKYLLLASGGVGLCAARHAFSIHEDMLSNPQFEIIFSETFIRESDALALMESAGKNPPQAHATTQSSTSTSTDTSKTTTPPANRDDDDDDQPVLSEAYEVINVPPARYFCAIPVLAPLPALNQTAIDLAKAEELREMTDATSHGWELLNKLNGQCLYYTAGYWSYSFCYNRNVIQYHALPPGTRSGPPVRDEREPEYVLGRALPQTPHGQQAGKSLGDKDHGKEQAVLKQDDKGVSKNAAQPNTELVIKGDQRYLVQRLDSGTVCDLTGRPRTIEIQYHCALGTTVDRIGWIKEVTTCSYLMMVQTPRLCEDVAFLPPKQTRAHPISCRQIVSSEDEVKSWQSQKTLDARLRLTGAESQWQLGGQQQQQQQQDANGQHKKHQKQQQRSFTGVNIGGVVIGSRNVLGRLEDGQPVPNLTPPRKAGSMFQNGARAGAAQPIIELLALAKSKAEGGQIEVVSDEDLLQLELDPVQVEELREALIKLAGDKGWKLEILEHLNEVAEFRGVVQDPHDPDNDVYYNGGEANAPPIVDGAGRKAYGNTAEDDRRAVGNKDKDKGGKAVGPGRKAQKQEDDKEDGDMGDAGSEERFFKDEL